MKTLRLVRVNRENEEGAFGVLLDDAGYPFAVTIERTFGSATVIPAGTYRCHRDYFHRGKYETYEVEIAGHDRVLFHKANVETDLEGCVGVARRFGSLKGRRAVLDSAGGFSDFMTWAGGAPEFDLAVSDPA